MTSNDDYNCTPSDTTKPVIVNRQIEHILYAINDLENSIPYITSDNNDPQYMRNLKLKIQIKGLYLIIQEIIDKDIFERE